MFTPADLSQLLETFPDLGVSVFLPTHGKGRDTLQGPIRLKNLLSQAQDSLVANGLTQAASAAFLAPAAALVNDLTFWQYQDQGLALFLSGDLPQIHHTPFPLPTRVVVGPGFHVRPLLTGWAADGPFWVLTVAADGARLMRASRFTLQEEKADLPRPGDELAEPDYENPAQASPIARPHTGSIDISHAQVYGASPPEWRKGRLIRYVHRVAAAVDRLVTPAPVPVVLAADAEVSGHFRKFSTLGPLLAGVIEVNAGSLEEARLHEAAYALVQPYLEADRRQALNLFATLRGNEDGRAVTGVPEVIRAAHQGRVDTLLLVENGPVWGRYEDTTDEIVLEPAPGSGQHPLASAQDLLDVAAVQTLRHGGHLHVVTADVAPDPTAAAILRY